jgi:hypothetical protein
VRKRKVRPHAALGRGNSLGRQAAHCRDRSPRRASGHGRSPSGGETARCRGHCGAHIGSLSATGGHKEGPGVRHPALHVLTRGLWETELDFCNCGGHVGLNRENAEALMKLFSRYSNISYELASHEHLYYNAQTGDTAPPPSRTEPSTRPPFYLVSGGPGGPLEGTPENGGFHHYPAFQVNGDRSQPRLVRLP